MKTWQKIALFLCCVDFVCVVIAYSLTLWLRFEGRIDTIPHNCLQAAGRSILWYAFFCIVIYASCGLYNRIWRFAGYRELQRCLIAAAVSIAAYVITMHFVALHVLPRSYFIFGGILQFILLTGSRFIWRFICLAYGRLTTQKTGKLESAMLIGGGSAGQLILRDLSTTRSRNIVFKCIIDDDKAKWGCRLEDVPIIGGQERIMEAVRKYCITKIFVALPSASAADRKRILEQCQQTGCTVRVLPGIFQFSNGEVSLAKMRDVAVSDMLAEEPLSINDHEIGEFLHDRVVLVTGGGGDIGAELCHQISSFGPKKLLVLDISEDRIEYLKRNLQEKYPHVAVEYFVGSVRDTWCLEHLFQTHRPEIVLHAATYKRVVLMENSPAEAIKNNVLGTYKTAYFALLYGCRRFILVSTDKAVNPISFVGACARLNEMLMQALEHLSRTGQLKKLFLPTVHHALQTALPDASQTEFTAIRFGNTLDSNGSFFTRFRQQVADGGPVTISHPKVSRFCMGLHDTISLFLQAATYAKDGEVFVLDMGTPVKLDDIARKLISLSGLVPDHDIAIQYTGLQSGEKLEEEPLMLEEGMRKTPCPRIYIANPTQINFDDFIQGLKGFLQQMDQRGTCQDFQKQMAEIVNSYRKVSPEKSKEFNPTDTAMAILGTQSTNSVRNLEHIIDQFDVPGEVISVLPITKGYINHTYYVDARQADGSTRRFILQRINTKVFPDANGLMDNTLRVTTHLKDFRLKGRPDEPAVAQVIQTRDGKNYVEHASGAWRVCSCFKNVHSYDIPESAEVFQAAGEAFGGFLKAMADLPAPPLVEVIPNFHNTWSRYQDLLKAIDKDPVGRVSQCGPEIEFVKQHEELFKMIAEALAKGEIPLRTGHNDCNLNNVLFDNDTNLPVAVIDLDTTMPSSPLYDFGDSIRIGTNTARDDEKDLSKVACNLEFFAAYARGWLSACGDMLTSRERELLPYAALIITSEDGIRFLMDHINGDTYYYIYYAGQNLDRARTQFALLADMERKLPKIKEILSSIQ